MGLNHGVDLLLHCIEVERCRVLHRRIVDGSHRECRDPLLNENEPPELPTIKIVHVPASGIVQRFAVDRRRPLERVLAEIHHQRHGLRYPAVERSFRQTIHGRSPSDRGFQVVIDERERRVVVSFNAASVGERHAEWLRGVSELVGLGELNPQPYWGFDDLEHKAGTKLSNTFYVQAQCKVVDGREYFKYERVMMLQGFHFPGFLDAIRSADILVDFDARTGHNHGTKFRLRQNRLPSLYEQAKVVI